MQSKTTIVKLTEHSETMTRHKEIARQLSDRTVLRPQARPTHHLSLIIHHSAATAAVAKRRKELIYTETRFISDNEQKLTVLYALQTLGPVTDHQLLTFLTVCDTMNWFSMKLGLVDLEDEGMIIRQAHPLGELWLVTEEGQFCLKQFSGRIPMSRRIILIANAPEWRLRFKSLQQSPAEAYTEPDGRIRLQLRLAEDNELLMDLMILLPEGTEIKDLGKKWEKAAPEIYRELLIRMQPETTGENRETVLLEEQDCSLLIMLPVNNETDREQIRFRWTENRNELVQKILKIL